MNKKEIKSAINKAAYALAESMGYEVHDDEGDGTVSFIPHEYITIDDTITWHRSSHETCVLNWSSDKTKADADAIDAHMKPIIEHYNNQYTPKHATAQFGSYIHGIKLNDMNKQTVYLVVDDMGYDGISLIDAKAFINKADAEAYKKQLEQGPYTTDIIIEEIELN